LAPAEPEEILDMLMPVMALTGGAGMSPDDRREWMAAAIDALGAFPADGVSEALKQARLKCDHPSKVIPFVTEYCEDIVRWRTKNLERAYSSERVEQPALVAPGATFCTAEEAAEIVDRVFPQARSLRDTPPPVKRGPPRMPTKADYLALGVDPAVVEAMR
jgi:hypothetical protein